MKYCFLFIFLFLSYFTYAIGNEYTYNDTINYFYTSRLFWETYRSLENNEIENALLTLKMIDETDPNNITIKENILELMQFLITSDSTYIDSIIAKGEYWSGNSIESEKILKIMAKTYLTDKDFLNAESKLYKLSNAYPRDSYFLDLAVVKNKLKHNNSSELIRILEISDDRYLLTNVALELKKNDEKLFLNTFKTLYASRKDEFFFIVLLDYYNEKSDYAKSSELISTYLDSSLARDESLITELERVSMYAGQYNNILKYKNELLALKTENFVVSLLFSAKKTGDVILADSLERVLAKEYELQPNLIKIRLAAMAIIAKDYDDAFSSLSEIDEQKYLFQILISMVKEEFWQPEEIIKRLKKTKLSTNLQNFIKVEYYLDKDKKKAEKLLAKIDFNELRDDQLVFLYAQQNFKLFQNKEQLFKIYLRLSEKDISEKIFAAEVLSDLGYSDEAEVLYLEEINSGDTVPENIYMIVLTFMEKNGKISEQREILQKAIAEYPESDELLNWYGYYIAMFGGDIVLAESMLEKALLINPDAFHIKDSLAWLFYKTGRFQESAEIFESIIKNNVQDSELYYHAGKVQVSLRNFDKATYYFEEAIRLNTSKDAVENSYNELHYLKEE